MLRKWKSAIIGVEDVLSQRGLIRKLGSGSGIGCGLEINESALAANAGESNYSAQPHQTTFAMWLIVPVARKTMLACLRLLQIIDFYDCLESCCMLCRCNGNCPAMCDDVPFQHPLSESSTA